MADNVKAAALAANLQGEQKKQVDDLVKSLFVHKELSNLPKDVAAKKYAALPANQQADLTKKFGTEDPLAKPSRGWLGTAWHYATLPVVAPAKLTFKGLVEASDLMTRVYRAAAIPISQGEIGFAWDQANDKGDKVYNEGRIEKAKAKFGQDAVDIAMRIKSGEDPSKLFATATPEQQKYIMLLDPQNKIIPGVDNVEAARDLFNDTLAEVDRAKFSPGRQLANLLLPEDLEKNGLVYGLVSGTADAAYRLFADPLVVGSKIRSLYTISKYSLDVVVGGGKVETTFAKPQVAAFWDQYGAKLEKFTRAQKANDPNAMVAARRELEVFAPEFGPEVVRLFQKAEITDANSAKAFFLNTEDSANMLKGAVGRKRVMVPRLDAARKIRLKAMTGADKVFNLDRMAPRLIDDMYGPMPTSDGIVKTLSDQEAAIALGRKVVESQKGVLRLSSEAIGARLDRFKAKFNIAPIFKDDTFDVQAKDASTQIYRLARLVMTKQDSKMIAETFEAAGDTGLRKEMVKGLWATIAEARGMNLSDSTQKITRLVLGKGDSKFAVSNFGDDFADIGAIPSDFTTTMSMPNIIDIDRAAGRSGLISSIMGQANKEWVDKMTGYWSFFTLAGPRYAIRNAGEDLMVHLAIGGSTWGLVKGRYLGTRVNTALEAVRKTGGMADNPLGSLLRVLNKKEAARYEAEIAGIDNAIVKAREEIKNLREQIKLTDDATTKTALEAQIIELKKTTTVSATEQTRRIMATALTSGRVNRYREALGMGPMFEDEAAILAEHLIYGNLDNSIALISEGGFNFATGGDFITRSTIFTRTHGVRSEALVVNEPKAQKFARAKGDGGYRPISLGSQDEAAMLTWLMRMTYYSNDELGAIAVANLDSPEIAIAKIKEWMSENPGFRADAQLAARDIDEATHAQIVYNRAKEIFEKRGTTPGVEKEINLDLLNKIRTRNENGDYVISGKLSLDDVMGLDAREIPEYVLGPTLVPISSSGQVTSSVMSNGWTWLGMANARMSRQPIVFSEIIKIRQQMKKTGFEDEYIKSVVSKVDQSDPKKIATATERAKRQLAELVEERAVSQTLAYVDNPLVRTQLAFGARNFSRFYRATEDFYRRVSRAVTYNPMAIRKAALTYDGISHNGWIQEDDQGEKYFVYPGIEPIYTAVRGAMTTLGIPAEFKTPFPVQFGAQVKMLTPSLNQDSLIPTFSGPLAGVSMKVITNLIGLKAPGAADHITELSMGKYAVGRSFVSAFLPAHINRLYETMDTDERDSQYASAWRKAVTYLEAAGHGLPEKYDETGNLIPPSIEDQEEYRQRIKNTVLGILGTRFVFGFFAPASPSVQLKADMSQWVKDNGKANFKQAWNGLLDQYPGDYDAAMAKWVELFPNEIPFTIPESEKKTVAIIKYAEESGAFVEQNKDLFKSYPQGAAFLIPHKSGFSWDAYKTMKDMGLKYNKRVDDYLREVQTASDLQQYYSKKNDYEVSLEGMVTDIQRTMARQEFTDWAKTFKAGRPLVQEELAQGGKKAIARLAALDDLRRMLEDKNVTVRGPVQKSLKEMLDVYDAYNLQKQALQNISGTRTLVSFMQDEAIVKLRELAKANENTMSAYNTMFASLIGDTNG